MKRLNMRIVIIALGILFSSFTGVAISEADLYKVGIGDVLSIETLGHPNLKVAATTVSVDGTIAFPNLGIVYVKDKTIGEIKDEITKRLSEGYIKYPVVSVYLIRASSKKVFIQGNVVHIGAIPFEKDMTIVRAISIAAGINKSGLFGTLKLRRKQKDGSGYKDIVWEELNNGKIMNKKIENTMLQPDDILIVEPNETFLIQGEVGKRGRLNLEKDMTVLRALLEAGGVGSDGRYGMVSLRRKEQGKPGGYKNIAESKINDGVLESSKVEDIIIQPDDILIVERNETFLIQGEVVKRGQFVLKNDMTVLRALLEAGGVSKDGRYGKIKVRRKVVGKRSKYKDITESKINDGIIEISGVAETVLQPNDILIVERNYTFLVQGAINKRGRFVLETDMTVLRALLEAGGVNSDANYGKIKVRRKEKGAQGGYKDIAESPLNDGTIEKKEVEDLFLQTDDILIVEENKTFFIYGEAKNTGEFVLKRNMTVFKALTIARGFTKWGSKSGVKILRLNDNGEGFQTIKVNINDVLKGDASADILIQPADTIVVSSGVF